MTTFVDMYHPALGNVHVLAASEAVSLYEAHGWLLSGGGGPAPDAIGLTVPLGDVRYAKLGDIPTAGTPTGDALRAAFVPFWAAAETVTAGMVRVDATGHLITRNANGTTRATYDVTEQAAWTVVSGGGGGGGAITSVNGKTGVVVLAPSDIGADAAGAATAAQAFAVQRGNHTGTQAAGTITGLATVATTGAYNDLSGKPANFGSFMYGLDPAYTDGTLVPPWRPAAPLTGNLVTTAALTGGAFPVTTSSAATNTTTRLARIPLSLDNGQPVSTVVRLLFALTMPATSASSGHAFLSIGARTSAGATISGYSDINIVDSALSPTGYAGIHELANLPSTAAFIDVNYVAQNSYTGSISLAALDARHLAAKGDLIRCGSITNNLDTTTTAASVSFAVDRPAYDKDDRLIRLRTTFAPDGVMEGGYNNSFAFPDSAYHNGANPLPGMGDNATGTFSLVDPNALLPNAPLHIGNNDLVLSVQDSNLSYELRCNTHGGELGRNGNMSLDYIFEVDRGDGTWQRIKGNGWQYAGYRVRATIKTKVTRTGDASPFANIDRVYTFFADGTTRVDRTVTWLADTPVDKAFIIMNSLDYATQANLGRLGVGQQVLREFNGRRPTSTIGGSLGATPSVALTAASIAGATTVTVSGASQVLSPGWTGSKVSIGSGGTLEFATVASVSGQTLTLAAALTNAHSIGDAVYQVDDPTTLAAATAAGTTSITVSDPVARNAYLLIDTGRRQERRRVTANPTGTGPYTLTVDSALIWAHKSGATVELIYAGDDDIRDGRNEWAAYQEPQHLASFGQIFDRAALTAHIPTASLYSNLVRGAGISIAKAYTIIVPSTVPTTVTNGAVWSDTFYWRYYIPRDQQAWHQEISNMAAISTAQRAAIYSAA